MMSTTASLWLAVVASGLYHGINPGMGWPLAVSAALMERRKTAIATALLALAAGHFLAMTAVLLPFTLMATLAVWASEIRIAAGLLVIGLGLYLLINRRHPRFLARVPPARLALWSFLAATAHGAGLMLVPIFLGICRADELDAAHQAASVLMAGNIKTALMVSLAHTAAMSIAGSILAISVYFWLGLKFLSKSWFNLDVVWALSLILVGVIAVATASS